MLADAVTGDKRLEKFRHTRPELEPGVSTHPADDLLRWNASPERSAPR